MPRFWLVRYRPFSIHEWIEGSETGAVGAGDGVAVELSVSTSGSRGVKLFSKRDIARRYDTLSVSTSGSRGVKREADSAVSETYKTFQYPRVDRGE